MSKYLRYEKCISSPGYVKILHACRDELAKHGRFEKDDIIERVEMKYLDGDIRWDYVIKWLEEKLETKLIAMSGAYFRRHKRDQEIHVPAKFMAAGNGRKAVGFVSVTKESGHFVLHKLKVDRAKIHGLVRGFKNVRSIGAEAKIPELVSAKQRQISNEAA